MDSLERTVSELFHALRGRLYGYLLTALQNSEEAEDLTQDCFLRLYKHLYEGGSLEEPRLWLFRVAHNAVLNQKQIGHKRFEAPLDWEEAIARRRDTALNPEQALLQRERYAAVNSALKGLTQVQREVLYLRSEGIGYKQIADILSIGQPAVAAHVRRGIERIKVGLHD